MTDSETCGRSHQQGRVRLSAFQRQLNIIDYATRNPLGTGPIENQIGDTRELLNSVTYEELPSHQQILFDRLRWRLEGLERRSLLNHGSETFSTEIFPPYSHLEP